MHHLRRGRVDHDVGQRNAEPLAGVQRVDIGQAVEGCQRPGIEPMGPGNAGQRLAGGDFIGAGHERASPRLLARVPGGGLGRFARVRDDDDLGRLEPWRVRDVTGGENGGRIDAKLRGDAVERIAWLHDVA